MSAAGSVYGWQRSKGSCGKSLGAISWWLGGAVTYICSMKPDCLNMLDGGKMKGITTRGPSLLTSRELQLRHSGVDEMESERSADWVDVGE